MIGKLVPLLGLSSIRSFLFAGSMALLSAIAPANAAVLFFDNFDTQNGGTPQLNFFGFTDFTVTNAGSGGAVDLIGNGFFDFYPGNGLYVDICGSASICGILTANPVFAAGNYTVTLELGGNAREGAGSSDTTLVTFGTNTTSYTLTDTQQLTAIWNVTLTSPGQLSISDEGLYGPDIGNILFSVEVDTATTPLPAAFPLFATGLGALGLFGWHRKRKNAAALAAA
jgi:hypothetical protein